MPTSACESSPIEGTFAICLVCETRKIAVGLLIELKK